MCLDIKICVNSIKKKEKHYRGSPLEIERSKHLKIPTNKCILAADFNALWYPSRGGANDQIQRWATLNDWRNAAGELLHNKNKKNSFRTDTDIAELYEHRPIWAHYTVTGGIGTQGRVNKEKKAK